MLQGLGHLLDQDKALLDASVGICRDVAFAKKKLSIILSFIYFQDGVKENILLQKLMHFFQLLYFSEQTQQIYLISSDMSASPPRHIYSKRLMNHRKRK